MVFIGRAPFAFCLKNTSYYMHIGKMKFHKQFNEKEWYFLVNNAGNELFFFQKIKQKELQLLMVRCFCSSTTIHCIYAMYKTIAVTISSNIIASSFLKHQYGFYYNTDFRPNILWVLYPKVPSYLPVL